MVIGQFQYTRQTRGVDEAVNGRVCKSSTGAWAATASAACSRPHNRTFRPDFTDGRVFLDQSLHGLERPLQERRRVLVPTLRPSVRSPAVAAVVG